MTMNQKNDEREATILTRFMDWVLDRNDYEELQNLDQSDNKSIDTELEIETVSRAETKANSPQRNIEQRGLISKRTGLWYKFISALCTLFLAFLLLAMVEDTPNSNVREENPTFNEVSERYIEQGLDEAGAANFVAGLILDYRAFDTLGEATMAFTSGIGVFFLMQNTKKTKGKEVENEDPSR